MRKPAFALHRLEQDAGGSVGDRGLDGVEILEGNLVETGRLGAEAVDIFLLTAAAMVAMVRPWNAPSKVMMW